MGSSSASGGAATSRASATRDLLAEGLAALDLTEEGVLSQRADYSPEAMNRRLSLLRRYIGEIELFNPAYGLVGVKDRDELVVKHILDSLAPLKALGALLSERAAASAEAPRIADVGSGAGLPGIPLSLFLDTVPFTLIERMGRRVGFLNSAIATLALKNVTVEQSDAERAAPGRFSVIVFRAFRPLDPPMLKTLFKLLAPGGVLAAYKGRKEKVDEEMSALRGLVGSWREETLSVPFLDEERRLVVVEPPR